MMTFALELFRLAANEMFHCANVPRAIWTRTGRTLLQLLGQLLPGKSEC